jgi:hypothetical protein
MRHVLFGEIVTRDGEHEVGRLGRVRDAEYGAREESAVGAGRGEAFEFAGCCGVDLNDQSGT